MGLSNNHHLSGRQDPPPASNKQNTFDGHRCQTIVRYLLENGQVPKLLPTLRLTLRGQEATNPLDLQQAHPTRQDHPATLAPGPLCRLPLQLHCPT